MSMQGCVRRNRVSLAIWWCSPNISWKGTRVEDGCWFRFQVHFACQSSRREGGARAMKQLPQVLLVDDNPADVVLAREALAGGKHQSHISNVQDGEEALAFLHPHRAARGCAPSRLGDPRFESAQEGRSTVLAVAKADKDSAHYPSGGVQYLALDPGHRAQLRARRQLLRAQAWESGRYFLAVQSIEEFWFGSASLPERKNKNNGTRTCACLLIEDNPGER